MSDIYSCSSAGQSREEDVSANYRVTAIAAIVLVACIVEVILYMGPFFISSIVNLFSVGEGTAGFVVSLELIVIACSAQVLSKWICTVPTKKLAFLSLAVIVAANLQSYLVTDFNVFVFSRVLAGIGEGGALAIATSMATHAKSPHKVYATITFMAIIAAALLFSTFPLAIQAWGDAAVYLCLVLLTLLIVPVTYFFPAQVQADTKSLGIRSNTLNGKFDKSDILILMST